MIPVEVIGTVERIEFRDEGTLKFIITNQDGALLGTLTYGKMGLAHKVKVGAKLKIIGCMDLYRKISKGSKFIQNVLYVKNIEIL